MKRLSLIFIVIAVIFVGGVFGKLSNSKETSEIKAPNNITQAKKEDVGIPVRLEIPSIKITANVESVGLDEKRNMDVPKKDENVGWYQLGVKPGEKGSAVMAGHLDGVDGGPAVFWYLSKLGEGDKIKTIDEKGNLYVFEVYKKATYDFDKFPLRQVFADDKGKYLNLITCDGTFDKSSKNYSKRTVVYAKLID